MTHKLHISIIFIMIFLCHCSATPHKRSMGEVVDDNVIHVKLDTRYMKDKVVEAKDVKIKVWKGVVTLTGKVDKQRQIDRAIELAEQQKGVTEVKAYLTLKNMYAKQKKPTPSVATKQKKNIFSFLKPDEKNKKSKTGSLDSQKVIEEDIIEPKSALSVKEGKKNSDYSEFEF